jgi:hypothetical protein
MSLVEVTGLLPRRKCEYDTEPLRLLSSNGCEYEYVVAFI